jgi:hypothetical protein
VFRKFFLLVGLLTYVNACTTDENGDAANAVAQTTITITAVTPTVADWDTQVTLTGTGYGTAGGIVLLNRVPGRVETWTDTEVKFRVPTGVEPGFATLTLVAGESFTASTLGIRPTLVTAPVSARAGAQISITGHNLGSAGALSLLGAERTELNATWSPTAITATIPYGFEPGRYTLEAFNAFAASVTFDVVNSAPSLTSVSLGGAPFYEGSTLVALPSGWSDPDNDREGYRFQWHRNGFPIVGATGEFLTGQDFEAGDQLFVRVVPDDGSDQGMAVDSTAVTILNSAPVLVAAYVADASYGAGSEIRVTPLSGVDADGECGNLFLRMVRERPGRARSNGSQLHRSGTTRRHHFRPRYAHRRRADRPGHRLQHRYDRQLDACNCLCVYWPFPLLRHEHPYRGRQRLERS